MLCCQKLRINNVITHEVGCAEAWRDYWRKCLWCGASFRPERKDQVYCSDDCVESGNS